MGFWDFLKRKKVDNIQSLDKYYKKVSSNIEELQKSLGCRNEGIFENFKSELVRLKKEIDILKNSRNISKERINIIYKGIDKLNKDFLYYASIYQNQYRVK